MDNLDKIKKALIASGYKYQEHDGNIFTGGPYSSPCGKLVAFSITIGYLSGNTVFKATGLKKGADGRITTLLTEDWPLPISLVVGPVFSIKTGEPGGPGVCIYGEIKADNLVETIDEIAGTIIDTYKVV